MGKKHKKHHKKASEPKDKPEEPPIRLVLKVGTTEKAAAEPKVKEEELPAEVQKTKEHSSKKKKKKRSSSKDRKKRKHTDGVEDQGFDSSSTVESTHEKPKKKAKIEERKTNVDKPIITKIHIKPIEPPKIRESKRPKPQAFHDVEPTPVILCIREIHETLQRKDVNGFFAYPVNDMMAPGYSSIITNPMDFSTMKYKIDTHAYTTLEEFRHDFNLMCSNAMIYNTAETVYFKAAKKLQQIGAKIMSTEKLSKLYHAMGLTAPEDNVNKRNEDELVDVDTVDGSSTPLLPTPRKKDNKTNKKRNTVGQRILAKAEEAARKAAEKLAKKYPNSNIGFLRKDADGSTSLAILNPCSVDGSQSLPVNLGAVTGKLSTGSVSTTLHQEDKKNKASPVTYLKYGPFSSFSPSFDSSMATITKEDSDLLYSTYGDSTGAYYAQSLQAFVKDNIFAKDYADRVLDALTDGAHSKLMSKLQKRLEEEEEKERAKEKKLKEIKKETEVVEEKKASTELSAIDLEALLSLENEGIDVSFLKTKETIKSEGTKDVQTNLDKTAELINQLDEAQSERLSQTSQDTQGATPKSALSPSENEQQIAEKVTHELANLTAKVKPKDVVDSESVLKAAGVGDVSESLRKPQENDQDEMEVQLAAEAIETVFNDATTMEDLDKVICEAAREVEDAMGLDVLDDLTASLDNVKQMEDM